jgi:hypothetical protein
MAIPTVVAVMVIHILVLAMAIHMVDMGIHMMVDMVTRTEVADNFLLPDITLGCFIRDFKTFGLFCHLVKDQREAVINCLISMQELIFSIRLRSVRVLFLFFNKIH